MKYFLDTEFYEDGERIDLISIAIVTERVPMLAIPPNTSSWWSESFYAVSKEARLDRVSPWVRDNVLPHLPRYGDPVWLTRAEIRTGIEEFIARTVIAGHGGVPGVAPRRDQVEMWAYYADYDWVTFCQLFGTMMGLRSTSRCTAAT